MATICLTSAGSFVGMAIIVSTVGGCNGGLSLEWPAWSQKLARGVGQRPIQRVFSLYDQRPWLNLDEAGDRDPEGFHYRIFLDDGTGRGVLRDGVFHIAMYRIERGAQGEIDRTLVSDWHYPTSKFSQIKSKLLGFGYHVRLRWASKDIAGTEVEVVTRFEGPDGNTVSAGTKRLRISKYTS